MRQERGPDDAADEQVRRLLAAARHDGPVPDDVATRLDAALADLAPLAPARPDTRAGAEPADRPDELAARRRRRGVTTLLAAAAVVVVAGVGVSVGGVPGGLGSGGDESASSEAGGSTASEEDAPPPPGAASSSPPAPDGGFSAESGPGTGSDPDPDADPDAGAERVGVPEVRDGPRFVADLNRVLEEAGPTAGAASACAPPYLVGTRVRVRFDGRAADLVAAPPVDGARRVQVWACDGATDAPERSVTVPAP